MILVKARSPITTQPNTASSAADDEAKLIQAAKHNPAMFAPLYERYFDRVYAYCMRRVGDAQEAEDLCSLIFAKALSGLQTYRDGVFAAWLFGIAHNVVVDYYHKRRPVVSIEDVDVPAEQDDWEGEDRIIQQLMLQLTDEQRDLLAMSLESELSSQEIGAALGKSPGAVRVQLHRTFKQLRKQYLKLTGER